ncbi:TniQ family protein [Streptomyces sp. NPDC058357]|uniref:TniQ family protein n=1 Tax=unclassified Streptomyces TaxID=2593676 RepID=UPI00365C4850
MTPRPLSRSLAPLPEESLPGLLLRLAYRMERSPARIAHLCGLVHRQNRLPGEYLLSLPGERIVQFAAATRLSVEEANALTLSSYAGVYPPLASVRIDGNRTTAAARKSWAASMSSRYCAACLSGDGSPTQSRYGGPWKLRWHLPVSYACVTHRTLLSHTCPRCGDMPNRPTSTERQGLIMHRTTSGLHPAQCRRPVADADVSPTAACAARLDDGRQAARVPDADLSMLLALQHRIDHRLARSQSPTNPGELASGLFFFPDLIVAAHLIRLSWPDGAHYTSSTSLADLIDRHVSSAATRRRTSEPAGRRPAAWDAPEDPGECAALLVAADALLGHEDRDNAGVTDRVRPLAEAAFSRSSANIGASLRRADVSPAMARALLRHDKGFYRAAGHRHARQSLPSRPSRFRIEHVPALLPQTWLSAHFEDLLSQWLHHTAWKVRHLRRVAALKLAEMSGGGTWPDCAKTLRIPWNTAQQSLKVVRKELDLQNLWPDYERAVERLASQLDRDTDRVHFGHRRELLSAWQVPPPDWAELLHELSQFGQGVTTPTRDTATVLIWAHVTQGDHLHSPVLTALRESGSSTQSLVASVNQLRTLANHKGSKRNLLRRLAAYSDLLATACDRSAVSSPTGYAEIGLQAAHLRGIKSP